MIPGGVNELLLRSAAAGGATAGRSVRFNAPDSAYLSRTPASAGNQKTWSFSCWVKRSKNNGDRQGIFLTTNAGGTTFFGIEFDASDKLTVYDSSVGGAKVSRITSAVYRDFSAWYHLVLVCNTPSATANERVRLYVNGSEVTQFSTTVNPTQNADLEINKAQQHSIGSWQPAAGLYLDGHLALVHFIDGQALTPSSFGETSATTGQWIAKTYSGTYGTNGFFLDFADNSTAAALGYDAAGSNDWTVNNLSVTAGSGNDSLRDHPTSAGTSTGLGGEVSGNYCTINPLTSPGTAYLTISNGNLDQLALTETVSSTKGTIGVRSGKWYWEVQLNTLSSGGVSPRIGICRQSAPTISQAYGADEWALFMTDYNPIGGQGGHNSSFVGTYSPFQVGDIGMFALDMDNAKIYFGKNGTWLNSGNPVSGTGAFFTDVTGEIFPLINTGYYTSVSCNFGQRAFAYTAPSGFSPLVDTLLPTPTIAKPNTVMDVALYTGNGSSQSVTGLGFSPDLVWVKERSSTSSNEVFDTVRGVHKLIETNNAGAEGTYSTTLTSFNSDGFSVGSSTAMNESSQTYVAWTWDAGSSNATNTSGSTQSTVRANISAGFSVVTYAPSSSAVGTVGHGLGVAPEFYIVKKRSLGTDWAVYHKSIGATKYLRLNGTLAATTDTMWNNTEPTSSVFSYGKSESGASSGDTYVAYCWTPVAGYSAFGSYTGDGSEGPFVYTGFRPRWVMLKKSSSTSYWYIYDAARDTYNAVRNQLYPNASDAEYGADVRLDFLSNGFKLRSGASDPNSSGTWIYACFAESPLAYARAR